MSSRAAPPCIVLLVYCMQGCCGVSQAELRLLPFNEPLPLPPPPPPPPLQAKMGVALRVLDPTPACPASTVAQQVVGSFRDFEAVKSFAQGCDVLTVEIEHIDADAMQVWGRVCVGVWGAGGAAAGGAAADVTEKSGLAVPKLLPRFTPHPTLRPRAHAVPRRRRWRSSRGWRCSPRLRRSVSSRTSTARSSTLRGRACRWRRTETSSAASAPRARAAPLATHSC